MGAIGSIRKHSGIAVTIVGLAIVAFIIGDLQKNRGAGQFEVAKIGKATFTIQTFNDKYEELKTNYMRNQGIDQISNDVEYRLREQVWQSMVEDTLMGTEYKKLGLAISEDEASSMMYEDGAYTHPYMRQWFTDPSTGQYNAQAAARYFRDGFDQLEPEMQPCATKWKATVCRKNTTILSAMASMCRQPWHRMRPNWQAAARTL